MLRNLSFYCKCIFVVVVAVVLGAWRHEVIIMISNMVVNELFHTAYDAVAADDDDVDDVDDDALFDTWGEAIY